MSETKREKTEAVLAAEAAVQKAREKLARVRKSASNQKRKERDTAIFTVGAVFLGLFKKDKEAAMQILDQMIKTADPALFYSNRRAAMRAIFGVDLPEEPEE